LVLVVFVKDFDDHYVLFSFFYLLWIFCLMLEKERRARQIRNS
jgi:hypothetical protein